MSLTLGRLIVYAVLIGGIVIWYTNGHTYVDRAYGCEISIRPSLTEWNTGNIIAGLEVLKAGAASEYLMVCQNVERIKLNASCGGWGGGCYYGENQTIHISTGNDEFLGWTAAIIAHEACHSLQRNEGRDINEDECYALGHTVLTKTVISEYSYE